MVSTLEINAFFVNLISTFISFVSTLLAVFIGLFLLDNYDEFKNIHSKLDKLTDSNEAILSCQMEIINKLSSLQNQIGITVDKEDQ